MNPYDNFGNIKPGGGHQYLEPGEYVLAIEALKHVNIEGKGLYFTAELVVVESNASTAPPGSRRSWMRALQGRYQESDLKAIKAFVMAALALTDASHVNGETMQQITSDANPLRGVCLRCSAFHNATASFTKTRWTPHTGPDGQPIVNREILTATPAAVPAAAPAPRPAPAPAPAFAPAPAAAASPGRDALYRLAGARAAPAPAFAPAPAPAASVPPAPPAVFPPAGWAAHPDAPGYYYRGQEVLTEAQLRALGQS